MGDLMRVALWYSWEAHRASPDQRGNWGFPRQLAPRHKGMFVCWQATEMSPLLQAPGKGCRSGEGRRVSQLPWRASGSLAAAGALWNGFRYNVMGRIKYRGSLSCAPVRALQLKYFKGSRHLRFALQRQHQDGCMDAREEQERLSCKNSCNTYKTEYVLRTKLWERRKRTLSQCNFNYLHKNKNLQ